MKFLVFQHVKYSQPGLISTFAKEHFIELDVIEFWDQYTIPDAASYQALIILDGPMTVSDNEAEFPSKNSELHFLKNAIGKLPMLGIGLGAQILAHTLGAATYPNVRDGILIKEIGYYDINLTDVGQHSPLFNELHTPLTALEWHSDTFDLPSGAELLASTDTCKNQAFSYQNIFGLQFHFEFTPDMVAQQILAERNYIHEKFVVDEVALQQKARDVAARLQDQNYKLLMNFLKMLD
jgi:GMP synthase (glutamine-hydrolysing)